MAQVPVVNTNSRCYLRSVNGFQLLDAKESVITLWMSWAWRRKTFVHLVVLNWGSSRSCGNRYKDWAVPMGTIRAQIQIFLVARCDLLETKTSVITLRMRGGWRRNIGCTWPQSSTRTREVADFLQMATVSAENDQFSKGAFLLCLLNKINFEGH